MSKFEEGLKLNLKTVLKEKNHKEYLPWATGVAELMKIYPTAEFKFLENEQGTFEFGNSTIGYVVKTEICTGGEDSRTIRCPLQVKDNRNNAILEPTVVDINTALMRCLAKNISMISGLGLTTYAGDEYYQSEIGEEFDTIKGKIMTIATDMAKIYDELDSAVEIIGHKGKVDAIKTTDEAYEIFKKIEKKYEEVKEKAKQKAKQQSKEQEKVEE